MMMDNMMSSMMLLGTKASGMPTPYKSSAKEFFKADDSFSGVFKDKLNELTKSSKRIDHKTEDKLPKAESSKIPSSEKAAVVKSSSFEGNKITETDIQKVTDAEAEKNGPEKKKVSDQETGDVLSLLAALLEKFNAKLDELIEKAAQGQPAEISNAVGTTSANPFEVIKALLSGQIDELKTLLNKLQADGDDTSSNEIVEQIKSLLSAIDQPREGLANTSNLHERIHVRVLDNGEENQQALLLKLKAQSKNILDKIKLKITELENAGNSEALPQEQQLSLDLPEDMASGQPEQKGEAKKETETVPGKESQAKTLELKPENSIETLQSKTQVDTEQVVSPEPVKINEGVEVKAAKTPFQLTEKPLSQSISNQVMMKVKLMAGEHKQEMEMHLKPESLGKLTLKIIHERGEILARITTENEQVKSILESNMQLLKDSLEKNGFSVQNLSVSVGNGNKDNNPQRQENQGEKNGFVSGGLKATVGVKETVKDRIYHDRRMNSSQIDLTA